MSSLALRGPYWVTVRQYRRTLWAAGALVLLALALIGGLRLWDARTPDVPVDGHGYGRTADDNHALGMLRAAMQYASLYLLLIPPFVGAFVAGPLIAREFESGTYKLSLTQSVAPAAWLRAKLLTVAVASLAATLALMGVFRIGWGRVSGTHQLHWGDRGPYESTGVVLVAYVLAAVAVGALLGLLVRRTLPAMAATGLVMGVTLLVLGNLRWGLLPVRTATGPLDGPFAGGTGGTGGSLLMESGLLTAGGGRIDEMTCWQEAAGDATVDSQALWDKAYGRCLAEHDVTGRYVDFHPRSHYWPTQLVETGILLALGALALFAAFRVLRARLP